MGIEEQKQRRLEISRRFYEISAVLAESKRAFFADGPGHGMSGLARAELEAELAALRLERHNLHIVIEASEQAAKARRVLSTEIVLQRLLHERGLPDLIDEAKRIADEENAREGASA